MSQSHAPKFQLCLLRLSAIGDVCHAAAMVNAIQAQRPDVEITWIIGKIEYQLLKDMPDVNFVIYDKKGGKQAKKAVQEALSHIEFDALFVMQVALRANLLSRVVRAKRRIGFDWHRSKEGHWLFTNERIPKKRHAHVLEGFMGFASTLNVEQPTQLKWNIPISSSDIEAADNLIKGIENFAVISPAASKAERNWTAKGYAAVADYLAERQIPVILCGGPAELDRQTVDAIKKLTSNIHLDLVGKTNLKQLLHVLSKARVVIAPDTGPAHMATTQHVPVVGLYAHSNPRRTGPYLSQELTASVYDSCIQAQKGAPWQELPWGARAKGTELMQDITIEHVIEKLELVLSQKK